MFTTPPRGLTSFSAQHVNCSWRLSIVEDLWKVLGIHELVCWEFEHPSQSHFKASNWKPVLFHPAPLLSSCDFWYDFLVLLEQFEHIWLSCSSLWVCTFLYVTKDSCWIPEQNRKWKSPNGFCFIMVNGGFYFAFFCIQFFRHLWRETRQLATICFCIFVYVMSF